VRATTAALPLVLLALLGAAMAGCTDDRAAPGAVPADARLVIGERIEARIDPRLFGQFLERASWGEPGPEDARGAGTRELRPDVVARLRDLRIPLIRFPGGTDVDHLDWRDLISHAAGRGDERPTSIGHRGDEIGNEFGLDEALALGEGLDAEVLLVVKFLAALRRDERLEDVADQAAALVAYCNAPVGRDLPGDLERWPRIRERNGRREPWNVRTFQIGNETWMQAEGALKREPLEHLAYPDDLARWYLTCLRTIGARMRAVDPSIRLCHDAPRSRDDRVLLAAARDDWVRAHVDFLVVHTYGPGPMDRGVEVPDGFEPDDDDWWWAWTAVPGEYDACGACVGAASTWELAGELGYPIAQLEWNWNGWGHDRLHPRPGIDPEPAAGLGAAAFLHGMLRHAGRVRIATQSILVGGRWPIAAVRYDPDDPAVPAWFDSRAMAPLLFARHRGDRLPEQEFAPAATRPQPIQFAWSPAREAVAVLDAVATEDDDALYVHVVNRDPRHVRRLAVSLCDRGGIARRGERIAWIADREPTRPRDPARAFVRDEVAIRGTAFTLAVPARSVAVFRIPFGG